MWKFKTSKYKNASPRTIKREECMTGVPVNDIPQTCSRLVSADAAHVVFNISSSGGCLGVLPLNFRGRAENEVAQLHAHSGTVTDHCFSTFQPSLLATGSDDATVKVWQLPGSVDKTNLEGVNPTVTLSSFDHRIDRLQWHTTCDRLLAVAARSAVQLYDLSAQQLQPVYELSGHSDQVQSLSWSYDGQKLLTTCRDKSLRLFDPRADVAAIQTVKGHQNVKESTALWLSDSNYCLTTGFNMMREREVTVRDVRNACASVKTESTGTASGAFIPLYDADTEMLFLAGKGETCMRFWEITYKGPFLTEASVFQLDQIMGATLVPKLVMDVMSCEVNRVMVMANNTIIPLSYYVPRKSYVEFHDDLYPNTPGPQAVCTAEEWVRGVNKEVTKVSLNPSARSSQSSPAPHKPPTPSTTNASHTSSTASHNASYHASTAAGASVSASTTVPAQATGKPTVASLRPTVAAVKPTIAAKPDRPASVFTGVRQMKCRHLKGTIEKDGQITNIKNLNQSLPWESDMFAANSKYCAFPLSGSAGLIAILNVTNTGRLPDSGLPAVQNSSIVDDFVWDPFNDQRLVVGCDDAKIKVWKIPAEGVTGTLEEPEKILRGHTEKLYFVRYNPVAKDILASSSYDMTVRLWNVEQETELVVLEGHTDTIFCLSWNSSGSRCITACKDKQLRVYDAQTLNPEPVQQSSGPEGTRGARIVWTMEDRYVLVSGFDKQSGRILQICNTDTLQLLHSITLNTAPAILVPHYDEDTHTVFLTGRGESMVFCYEFSSDHPHMFELSHFSTGSQHQSMAFLSKSFVDVRAVEFARALRLTTHSVEYVSFVVPRLKKEYFQDDIFPPTRTLWEAQMTAEEWISGQTYQPKRINLCPADMKPLSEAPKEAPRASKYNFTDEVVLKKSEQEVKDDLLKSLTAKMDLDEVRLPQDDFDGCDDDEWDD